MRMKVLFTAISFIALCGVSKADQWNTYLETAQSVKSTIKQGDTKKAGELAAKLVKISTALLPEVAAKKSICGDYLSAALAAATTMQLLSLEEIERDYHADGKLPAVKDVACYHAKDLLVHPATVVVLAKHQNNKKVKQQMMEEIEEVIEHFSQVKDSVSQSSLINE